MPSSFLFPARSKNVKVPYEGTLARMQRAGRLSDGKRTVLVAGDHVLMTADKIGHTLGLPRVDGEGATVKLDIVGFTFEPTATKIGHIGNFVVRVPEPARQINN